MLNMCEDQLENGHLIDQQEHRLISCKSVGPMKQGLMKEK